MKMKKSRVLYNPQISRKPYTTHRIMTNTYNQTSKIKFQKVGFKVTSF